MMEEEEERQRKREKRRQKKRAKQGKSGQPRPSTSSAEDDEEEDDEEEEGPEIEQRPSLIQRLSNQFSPANQSNSMFSRTSASGPNMRKGSQTRTNSAISPSASTNLRSASLSTSQSATNAQLQRLMSARQERRKQQQDQPKCGCTIS